MHKIQYKYRRWDKEVKELSDIKAIELEHQDIQTTIDLYLNPEKFSEEVIRDIRIRDSASFFNQLGLSYFILSGNKYMLKDDTDASIGYLYLYVKALAKSYELEASGIKIQNPAIEGRHSQKKDLEWISFAAAAIGRFELFEKYGDGIGCELIKAMYHKDYDKARQLAEELPNTEEMYEKYKRFESYYYGSCYMKDLYLSILNRDEKAFNDALIRRLKNVRTGYVMPIDIVSISMIRFAKSVGLECKFEAIEIPKALCADELLIDEEKYKLPDVT